MVEQRRWREREEAEWLIPVCHSLQTLAGPGLPDPLCVGATRHAAQKGGGMAGAAQLPPRHGGLHGRAVQGPTEAEVQLPEAAADWGGSKNKNNEAYWLLSRLGYFYLKHTHTQIWGVTICDNHIWGACVSFVPETLQGREGHAFCLWGMVFSISNTCRYEVSSFI